MYVTQHSLQAFGQDEEYEPIPLNLPPISGYGALTLPAMNGYGFGAAPTVQAAPPSPPSGGPVEGSGKPVNVVELSTGTKMLIFGVGILAVGGLGYLIYREVQLRSEIVKSGGGRALAEYELAKAAGTVASGLFGPDRSAQPNRAKRRKKKHSRRR